MTSPTTYSAGVPPRQLDGLSYRGAGISLLPVINLKKDPTTSDRNFPLMTFAINSDESDDNYGAIWYLKEFVAVTGADPDAIWIKLSGGSAGPIVNFDVPLGTSPVVPDSSGEVSYTSTGGSIDITGGANSINFDLAGGSIAVDGFTVPSGTSPVVPNASGVIDITAGSNITVTGGTNTYEIAATGVGQVDSVTGTADRITITGTASDPVVDIASTYVGQTSITTLGTVATGTWEATDVEVAYGGTGRSEATAYAVICGGTTSTAAHQSIASVGSAGEVLTSNGAGALPTFQAATGGNELIQVERAILQGYLLVSGNIPLDNTIPQNTEGTEVLTVTITPTSASSILEIEFNSFGHGATAVAVALFQDSTADALAAQSYGESDQAGMAFKYYMTSGTTNPTTFKIRVGMVSGNFRLGQEANINEADFGGVSITTMYVTEYAS